MIAASDRRARLATAANPDARHDYLVVLGGEPQEGTRLEVHYVPDRLVLTADSFAAYLPLLADGTSGLESVALAVLDDLNNEVVPRWVEVRAVRDAPVAHRVVVEDRQPGWDNPALMARLERL